MSRTAQLTAESQSCSLTGVESLSEEQLETLLSQRRLTKEKELLSERKASCVDTVTAKCIHRPTLYMDLQVGGVATKAMVYRHAQEHNQLLYLEQCCMK